MNRRHAIITAATLLLLCGATGPAFAARQEAAPAAHSHTSHSAVQRSVSLALVTRYFAALDGPGWPGRDGQALNRLYASNVTMIESLTTGYPLLHSGRQQVRAFDQGNTLSWYLDRAEQLSPGVIITIEQPYARGPGHELVRGESWLTVFTIKSGKIVNLVWMSC